VSRFTDSPTASESSPGALIDTNSLVEAPPKCCVPPTLVPIPVASAVGPTAADALNQLAVKPWLISPPSAENTKHSQASPGEKLISSLTV